MKKIIFSLITLMACMSINAQVVKVYDTKSGETEPEATYTNSTNHSYKVVFEEVKNFYNNNHEYIDLGLPSGTLWATCNIGGNHPEDYGYYFAWASTDGYTMGDGYSFTEELCPWTSQDMDSGDMVYDKYNSDDEITTLESDDDAANYCFGSSWRMPTQEDWEELREYCTFNHTSLNGVKGCYAIGPNDNFIFLPAAGYMDETGQCNTSEGFYWSSSLTENNVKYAYTLWFYSGDDDDTRPQADGCDLRYHGLSIRPVFKRETPTFKFSIIKTTLSVNQVSMASNLKVISRSDGEVTYTSSDESIACVDASTGSVMGKSKGTATITASVAETMSYYAASASYTVVVNPADPTCAFAMDSRSINFGDTIKQAIETNSDGAVTYSSSDESVATVDATTGEVIGVAAGTATITASVAASNKYNAGTATYTVTVANTSQNLRIVDFAYLSEKISGKTKELSLQDFKYSFMIRTNSSGTQTVKSCDTSVAITGYAFDEYLGIYYYVKPVGRGKAKITVTVAATDDYAAASDYFYVEVDDENLLTGKFSVSPSKQVLFTKSNIYSDGSNLYFESSQIGGRSYWDSSHVSHFYWTKDAQKSYAETYDDGTNSTTDVPFFAESNGGLKVEESTGLYVLSYDEWQYLLYSRPNASKLLAKDITVTSCNNSFDHCLIIAPDDYSGPALVTITDWSIANVNKLGLVCLPAIGHRDATNINNYGWNYNYYWSSTPSAAYVGDAWGMYARDNRFRGFAIRLVANP